MFEFLAGLALLQASAAVPPAYVRDSLSGFVAVENARPLEGIDYSDGSGLASAGLVYVHPTGLFAGTEFTASQGSGVSAPRERLLGLYAFAGYTWIAGKHRFAVELFDYRLDPGIGSVLDHQAAGLRYRRGGFQVELAHEEARPYYYRYGDRFVLHDTDRLAIGWQQAPAAGPGWSLGAGVSRIGTAGLEYGFVTGALHGHLNGADWRIGLSYADEALEELYGSRIDRTHLALRIAVPFRIF